ncbi:hypothetical protein CW745_08845 [Psychromonas sp. psych-6C06]|uniref:hypothetical protein n=1 Tax=Psychromonas sp. psych-6C06 TaxID=2058089 RepID=UPI000C345A9B|nr:hypothetical protein [Psychromonas sp. psych-6C06]PKF61435.1 hypothetical protein CW745_08845 [Psychromonas sp. psych-6C06]
MSNFQLTKFMANCFDSMKQFSFAEKIIRRNPLYYSKAKQLFSDLKAMPLTERKQSVESLLIRTLKSRTHHIKQFKADKGGLSVLPYINKKSIQENPKAFLGFWYKLSIPSGTGGSTGVPLRLYRSFPSIVVEQAAIDSIYSDNGIEPDLSKIAVLRGDSIKAVDDNNPPFWKYNAKGRILKLSAHHMNSNTIHHYVKELEKFKPDVIYAYPSAIEFFTHLVSQSGLSFNVSLLVTSSEVFTTQSRKRVSNILNCKTCDYFGQAERMAFAYSYEIDEYFFLPGYSRIELAYQYSEDEYDYYEVIGTSLHNNAMSVQRYCTGDLAVLPKGLTKEQIEEIAYGVKPFKGILGRTSEYLLGPDRQQLIGINQIPKFIDNVVQMQFVQDKLDHVNLYVVPEAGFNSENQAELLKSARKKIPDSVIINIIVTDKLEKTKAHKTPLVIRRC